jgi:hypothetical protein
MENNEPDVGVKITNRQKKLAIAIGYYYGNQIGLIQDHGPGTAEHHTNEQSAWYWLFKAESGL